MPPPQAKKGEPLTFGDRAVTALLGGICGFGTMLLVWFLILYAGGRSGTDSEMPFYWTFIVGGAVAAAAFLAGPERTMDAFAKVWAVVGIIVFRRRPNSDILKRRNTSR